MTFYLRRRPRFLRGPYLEEPLKAPVIRTDRLVLRPHRMADEGEWFRLANEPSIREGLRWPERDRRAARKHLRARTRHTTLWQADDFLALAVERDGRLVGDVSLHLRGAKPESRSAEIGWIVDPQAAGHGYATEAASAMLDFAFRALRARWVFAVIHPTNERSIAMAERLGLSLAGGDDVKVTYLITAEEHARRPGHPSDVPHTGRHRR